MIPYFQKNLDLTTNRNNCSNKEFNEDQPSVIVGQHQPMFKTLSEDESYLSR